MVLIFLIILLCSTSALHADGGFIPEYLTTEQGLSQSIVYSVFQDREGFLWFSTRDGLNRYDGYRFTVFRHDPFDPSSLPWTSVAFITEDGRGNIWVGVAEGVAMLDRRTFRFTLYARDAADPRSLSGAVTCMGSDREGHVWIGTEHGLDRFDPGTGGFIRFFADPDDPAALAGDWISSLHRDRFGDLWIGTDGGHLHRVGPDRRSFTRFDAGLGGHCGVLCFGDDREGRIYVGVRNAAVRSVVVALDRKSGAIVRRIPCPAGLGLPSGTATFPLCLDSLGGLWMGVERWGKPKEMHAICRCPLDGAGGVVTPVVGEVRELFCDRSGTMWGGTNEGVVKLSAGRHRFMTYRHVPGDRWSLSDDHIRAIVRDRFGTLWVGTDMGLNRLEEGSTRWRRYLHDPGNPRSISDNTVNTILEDDDGTLLIGTNEGLNVLDRATGRFSRPYRLPRSPGAEGVEFIWSLHRDDDGTLWVGTRGNGIVLFDRERRCVRHLTFNDRTPANGDRRVVWDIARDSHGDLWAATSMGLYRWIPGRDGFKPYPASPSISHALSEENVCAIMEDPSGTLWFTTYGGGLNRYNRATDDFTSITTHDGLPSNTLYGALMDDAGRLWISSNTGLTLYDPVTGGSHVYTVGDGLQGNEFSFRAWCRLPDGELLFGGIHGLTRFHPDSLLPSSRSVPMVITEFRVFDAIARQEIADRDTITLSHDQSFISFEFVALDYINPAAVRYAYRLEGFDDNWVYCGQRRYASFTNLDPGTYTFMVRGTNSDGVWNPRPLRVVLRVVPPYWMTWWFRSVAGVVLVAAGGAWIRSMRDRERLRRRSVESQLQALRLQVNPHFIFNALSSVQHLILVGEHDLAVSYLSRFSRLVRAVLENSERMSIPIAEEVETLRHYLHLESLRFEGRFVYTIDIDPLLDIGELAIPTMLIQPCVENAIRHGLLHKPGRGSLRIAIMESGARIRCVIEDDGIGRKRAGEIERNRPGQRRSMGVRVTEERLGILNAAMRHEEPITMRITDLVDGEGAPRGTRVEIFIPVLYP
jgi:ligand-binding sensor domain-containing protein